MNKKHILFFSDSPFFSGAENMLEVLITSPEISRFYRSTLLYRRSNVFHAQIIQTSIPSEILRPVWLPSFDNLRYKRFGKTYLGITFVKLLSFLFAHVVFFADILILQSRIKKISPDIVHINNGGYPGAIGARAAVFAAKLARVEKVIMVVNNQAVSAKRPSRVFDAGIDKLIRNNVDKFVTASKSAAARLQEVLNIDGQETISIPNALSSKFSFLSKFEAVAPVASVFVFGQIGHLTHRKGQRVAILAAKHLLSSGVENFEFRIEGDGEDKRGLLSLVSDLGLTKQVKFLGQAADISGFVRKIDALVIPSIENEDFPNVVVEAMSQGKAVIGSRLAGISEQVDDLSTGLLFEPGSAEELARLMKILIDNRELANLLGKRGLEKSRREYNASVICAKYAEIYS